MKPINHLKATLLIRAFFTGLCLLSGVFLHASHLRCGYISIRHLGNRNCEITVTIYTDLGSSVLFGDGELNFGDGTLHHPPQITATPLPDLGPDIGKAVYKVMHTYENLGFYLVSFREPNRSAGIINVSNSVETRLYIESFFTMRSDDDLYQSPSFLADPVFLSETSNGYFSSFTAVDSNSYRLVYFFAEPQQKVGLAVNNFQRPENFSINPYTGLITWDGNFNSGSQPGPYLFAVRICQYEDDQLIGYVLRDFQVMLEDAPDGGRISDNRNLDANNRLFIPLGQSDSVKVFFESESPQDQLSLTLYTALTHTPGVLSFRTYDSTSGSLNIKVGIFKLTPQASIDRDLPYGITVRGTVLPSRGKDISYLFYTRDIDDSILPDELFFPITEVSDLNPVNHPFPNPVEGYLNVGDSENVSVYSAAGASIRELKPVNQMIDLHDLPAGLYVLVLESQGQGPRRYRLVKR